MDSKQDALDPREERINKMIGALTAIFPDNKIEKVGMYIYITSTTDSFLGHELNKLNAISTLFGGCGFFISASVSKGLQAVIY